MSYIRATSNPENMYIYGTFADKKQTEMHVQISAGPIFYGSIPREAFHAAMLRLDGWEWDDGSALRCQGVTFKTTKDWKWTMRYRDWPKGSWVTAFAVTWHYIAEDVRRRENAAEQEG